MSCDEIERKEGSVLKLIIRFENVTIELINVYAPVKRTKRMCFLQTLYDNHKQCVMENYLMVILNVHVMKLKGIIMNLIHLQDAIC